MTHFDGPIRVLCLLAVDISLATTIWLIAAEWRRSLKRFIINSARFPPGERMPPMPDSDMSAMLIAEIAKLKSDDP